MLYLQRLKAQPHLDDLKPDEVRSISSHFDPYAGEVIIDGEAIRWNEIEEIEVVLAPRATRAAGWFVRNLVHGSQRYHVGLYFGHNEAVLPNVTLNVARYVVQCVAYYSPLPVRYKGPDGLSPTIQE
jgi:hypothetical protein